MNPLVIYHSADYDGIFCREIARKFLPDAELKGWNFGDPPIKSGSYSRQIYILDLPCNTPLALDTTKEWPIELNLIWIDHHKSSIEKLPKDIPGYRIDGVAACRLTWQWFTNEFSPNNPYCHPVNYMFPQKEHFIARQVIEPLAVRLAGEYDIWDKRDPRAETFQYGLRCEEVRWDLLLNDNVSYIEYILNIGAAAQRYAQHVDADLVKHRSYRMNWEGLNFIVLNTGKFNSLTFAALDIPETGHDALLGYMFNGKCWTISLYHAKHKTDIDLSKIAIKYGGGGHRGACGFTCDKLPF